MSAKVLAGRRCPRCGPFGLLSDDTFGQSHVQIVIMD